MKNFPVGIQEFKEIITKNYFYVDKTNLILDLINTGKFYFLSRPRRFGKSLLLSTIKEIFLGNSNLFNGLYIYDKIKWEEYPIISLSMSAIKGADNIDDINESLKLALLRIASKYDVHLPEIKNTALLFNELIKELGKIKQVVILIDEYDKIILDYISKPDISERNREFLREFYTVLKDNDEHIKFCILTGISRFSKVSIFSGLNNLRDITLSKEFSTLCGITQQELETNFNEQIEDLSIIYSLDKFELLAKIKFWYNGYSWDGENSVYNPFAILSFFTDKTFNNYWFSSGTPKFLVDKFEQNNYSIEEIDNFSTNNLFFESYDTNISDFRPLLFQTGYLTIKNADKLNNIYTIGYPNFEVKNAFLSHIASKYIDKPPADINLLTYRISKALEAGDTKVFIEIIKTIIANIPYQLHISKEAYYHSLFYLIMTLSGIKVNLEVSTNKGRIDGLIEFKDVIYILEFKYLDSIDKSESILAKAINQIKENEYFNSFLSLNKKIKMIAIAVGRKDVTLLEEELKS